MVHRSQRPQDITNKRCHTTQWSLTDEERAAIRADVAALPPLTDEEIDALCDIIIAARKRRQRRTEE
jgi:hypothetical protein